MKRTHGAMPAARPAQSSPAPRGCRPHTHLDTIYTVVGSKPVLFRTLIEVAISGTDRVVPAEGRDYVRAVHAEPDARQKLTLYAQAFRRVHERLAPLTRVLKEAADDDLAKLWNSIAKRRAANMRRFAGELVATGQLRSDVDANEVADVIWATNAPEFYLLLVNLAGVVSATVRDMAQ